MNDNQPEILTDDLIFINQEGRLLPKTIPLMSSKEKLQCRKVKAVLRYHTPNREKHPEKYAHHVLFMFYPFRKESDLFGSNSGTYVETLTEQQVRDMVNINKQLFEPFCDLVDSALLDIREHVANNLDSFSQQDNDEARQILEATNHLGQDPEESAEDVFSQEMNTSVPQNTLLFMSDNDLNEKIRSLNIQQRSIFDVVNKWARDYVKNLYTIRPKKVEPLHIFLTGKGGCGKSHLIRTIYHSITKTLGYHANDIEKPQVMLLSPTGVAAINIGGTTIHCALGIPVGNFSSTVPKLGDKIKSSLRNKYSELKAVIIDEVSMVSNKLLLYIHQRLVEIFGCSPEIRFAGVTVICSGDLYQLPPINASSVYAPYESGSWNNLIHMWKLFKIGELDEVMRQKGDTDLIDMLNKVRTGDLDNESEMLIMSRFISKNDHSFPVEALHIFAENKPAQRHNDYMLNHLDHSLFKIAAIDEMPHNTSQSDISKALNRKQSETGGLARILHLKLEARVMLTCNIDIEDRLINGQIGTVRHIAVNNRACVEKIFIELDDNKAGCKMIRQDYLARQHNWVPIEKTEASIKIRSNKSTSPVIKRTQFPLMLAWACTVHKVQGLSLDKVVISFDLEKQRGFKCGQMYVALSRVTSLQGLFLTGRYNP